MSDYSELKCLAESLIAHEADSFYLPCTIAFERAATPSVVLALIAENESLRKDWPAECLTKGFEYVREPDDHYVTADPSEMVSLLRDILGIDVRQKDGRFYGESVKELQDQIDGVIGVLHRQEEQIKSLRKDAERWRFVRNPIGSGSPFAIWSEGTKLFLGQYADEAIDAAISSPENP